MQIIIEPDKTKWKQLLQRPYVDNIPVLESVKEILRSVKENGDEAIRSLTKKYDGIALDFFLVSEEEMKNASSQLSDALKNAIHQAEHNIGTFHRAQLPPVEIIEAMPGLQCWRKNVPVEKVGLYVPGGTAPLFSTVLMLGIPAVIAGCREISLFTPCNKEGKIHPAILYSASVAGIKKVYKIGGAQAIAAMAFGTESIEPVNKVFGPGNQYVTAAKQLVQMQGVAIDMPAGPSEVCVLADETANAAYVAADLLSQAEHGADSQVILVCSVAEIVNNVKKEIEAQLENLPRKDMAIKALNNSRAFVISNLDGAIDLINEYAPEHLILNCKDASAVADRIINAGSVFIGSLSPESVGDYASGTNHTLPTNGFAKAYSGVSVDSFVKKITYQKLTEEGLNGIGEAVIQMAEAEGLQAHANAVKIRLAGSRM